jgi:hypothetical protein
MAQVTTSYRMGETIRASHTIRTVTIRRQRGRGYGSSMRAALRRLLAAVVNGSDHPCWRTSDALAQLALLPARDQNRLLDSGLVPRSR